MRYMKFPVVSAIVLFFIILVSCSKEKMRILPISPYERLTKYVEWDTTKEYYFAIENFESTKENMSIIDSFVLRRVPNEYKKENCGINFFFYEYEKGKIDENFVHAEQPKQENLFMEAGAKLLLEYSWMHGKFEWVAIFKNGRYKRSEERNW